MKITVTSTTSSLVALESLRTNKEDFDIVLSDVHMPDIDGFKLLEQIALEIDIPVLMMSANSDQSVVLRGIIHGAVDYLLKPVRIHELKNIWQHVVRKNGTVDGFQRSASMSMSPGNTPGRSGRGSPEKESAYRGMNATSNGINKKLRTIAASNNAGETMDAALEQGNTTTNSKKSKTNSKKANDVVGAANQHHQQQQQTMSNVVQANIVQGNQQQQQQQTMHSNLDDGLIVDVSGVRNGSSIGEVPIQQQQQQQQQQQFMMNGAPNTMGTYPHAGTNMMMDMNGMSSFAENGMDGDNGGPKKARVVWSAELHQRFVNAVNQLGIDKAVPKRILDLMDVSGLTRENVASHLQKYRLYLKRLQGGPNNPSGPGFLSNKVAGAAANIISNATIGQTKAPAKNGAKNMQQQQAGAGNKNNINMSNGVHNQFQFHPGAGGISPEQWNQQQIHQMQNGGVPQQFFQGQLLQGGVSIAQASDFPHGISNISVGLGHTHEPQTNGMARYSYGPVPIDLNAFTPIPLDFDDSGLGLGSSKGGFGSKSTDDMLSMFLKDGGA